MYRKLETAVVIPCYNEEKMITQTIKKIPEYIDHIIAVNDASTDNTIGVLNKLKKQYSKLIIVDNKVNQGVGGALITGYDYAIKNTKATAIGIVAGDDQFDSSYLKAMLDDFIDQSADYVKASRFFHREAFKTMPNIANLETYSYLYSPNFLLGIILLQTSLTGVVGYVVK